MTQPGGSAGPVQPSGPVQPWQPAPPAQAWQPAPHGQAWQPGAAGQAWQHPAPFAGDVPPGGQFPPAPLQPAHPWVPVQALPKPPELPVEPRQYHEFLRTPRMRWWRPIAALAMAGGLWFLLTLVFTFGAMGYDLATGRTTWQNYTSPETFVTTPAFFLVNNLALASAIPVAGLTQWACFGQRPRWLSSVVGGFRWRWFGECVLWVLPVFLVSLIVDIVLDGPPELQVNATTYFMIAAILLTTPLQSAGEEFLLRGIGQRAVAAWLPRTAGLVVSTLVTALIFMWLHGAGDPWLNAFYLIFAITASVLVWRTGGLEAAVALHAVNNVTSMVFMPFTDFSKMFDRAAGTGSPWMSIPMLIVLLAAGLLVWRAKRRGMTTVAAPAAGPLPGARPPLPAMPGVHLTAPVPPAAAEPWRNSDGTAPRP